MSTNTPAQTADMLMQVGAFMEQSGSALASSEKLMEKLAEEQVKVAGLVPPALKLLQEAGLVPETEVQDIREKLASHSGALQIIGRMARLMQRRKEAQAAQAPVVGQGVDGPPGTGNNGVRPLPTGYTPGPNDVRPSDAPFLSWLN